MSDTENLPKGWEKFRLDEISEFVIDCPHSTPKWTDTGFIVLRSQNIRNGKLNFSKISFTDEKGYLNRIKRAIPKMGDIVLTREAPMGEVCMIPNNLQCCLGQRMVLIRIIKDTAHNRFILYAFQSSFLKSQIRWNEGTGTTVSNIRIPNINAFEFKLPPIQEQKAIAAILTAFDDKIENLQAQNKTLEKTAQTIFKEWFGKYQIGDELPEGWKNYELSELVKTINGYSYKGKELVEESDEALVTLKSFDRNGGFQTRGFKPFKGKPKGTQEVQIGDLVVAHTDLTQDADVLGNPAFIFDNGGFNKMFITMDLVKVVSIHKDISSSFLYYLMKDRTFKGHCVGYSNGTTVLHLSKKAIPEYQFCLPSDFGLIKQFSTIADSTTNKISLNQEELKFLKNTRDTLLPKLMSGAIRVKDFKE